MNKKVKNKRKLNTKKIALLLIMIAIIVGSIILAIRKSKTSEKESWNIATDNYDISIDVPKLPTAEMENEIETYLKDVKKFKLLLIATMTMWLIYDTLIKSYTSATFDFATIVANIVVLIKMQTNKDKIINEK